MDGFEIVFFFNFNQISMDLKLFFFFNQTCEVVMKEEIIHRETQKKTVFPVTL